MKLIKQLTLDIIENERDFETEFHDAELEARKLGIMHESDEPKVNSKEDCERIAAYWRGKAHSMSDAQLKKEIGNDLEQLDYPPEQVQKLLAKILRMVKK